MTLRSRAPGAIDPTRGGPRARQALLLGWLVAASGCSGMALERAPDRGGAAPHEPSQVEAEPRDSEHDQTPGDQPLASDPYTERAGGDPGVESTPVELAFAAPPREAPLANPRPALAARGLSVAFVTARDGVLTRPGRALLDFERALQRQPAIDRVTALALGEHDAGADLTADVAELAAVAAAAGRDLLVIDARQGEGGEVLVIHATRGVLLQRIPRGAQRSESAGADLIDALAFAAADLADEAG